MGAMFAQPAEATAEVLRPPDRVTVELETETIRMTRSGARWKGRDVEVAAEPEHGTMPVWLSAPRSSPVRIHLRWMAAIPEGCRFLGDHWERSYGDLEWRGFVAGRLMPWYFLATDGRTTTGYGVRTGARSIACWQVDRAGITLSLDVHNGGAGVRLGERRLEAATVVAVKSAAGEPALAVARGLCRRMCEKPRLPAFPVYGGNNWYYTYGNNLTEEGIVRDSSLMSELAPAQTENRPTMVLDMGWTEAREGAGPIHRLSKGFPHIETLAGRMKERGVRPGIWVRPLLTVEPLPDTWRLSGKQAAGGLAAPFFVPDPSVPEALAHIGQSIRAIHDWGFELIKHDFSTFDITGRWGFQMGPDLTDARWHFADRSRTTAEIIRNLYATLRESAGDSMLIGCNTIGHLGAGLFEMQRIGDDTSGREWSRTRKMGVNTLAFRLPQHGTFFAADADCVAVTKDIPWEMTRQWLDLVTRSGTPLFVSADPDVTGARERAALKEAFAQAARRHPGAEPLDWMNTTTPARWQSEGRVVEYRWYDGEVT